MNRFAILVAALLATTGLAHAQPLDDVINSFVGGDGFTAIDHVPLEMDLAEQFLNNGSISPGGAVGPIEKAIMIATGAIDSDRTRTSLSYGEMIVEEDAAPMPVSFIEVRHYNLGPSIRTDTAEAYGEENTAEPEAFGIGEHMAWRFVFQPMMGNTALLMSVGHRVISDKQASKDDCAGRNCLELGSDFDTDRSWDEVEVDLPDWPAPYSALAGEIATPAFAIAQLAVYAGSANAETGDYQWTGGQHPEAAQGVEPYRFVDIDRNLGQEAVIDVVWTDTMLNDDDLFARSLRRLDIAGQLHWFENTEPRR